MALQRMDVKPFTTEEIGASNHARHSHTRFNRSRSHKRRRFPQVSRSLMVKIGICAAACAVILGMKALNTPTTAQVVSACAPLSTRKPISTRCSVSCSS